MLAAMLADEHAKQNKPQTENYGDNSQIQCIRVTSETCAGQGHVSVSHISLNSNQVPKGQQHERTRLQGPEHTKSNMVTYD